MDTQILITALCPECKGSCLGPKSIAGPRESCTHCEARGYITLSGRLASVLGAMMGRIASLEYDRDGGYPYTLRDIQIDINARDREEPGEWSAGIFAESVRRREVDKAIAEHQRQEREAAAKLRAEAEAEFLASF